MATDSYQIREFLQESLKSVGRVSLVNAIAHYDYRSHAIPSTWRVNLALSELTVPVVRISNGFTLELASGSVGTEKVQITELELLEIVNQYRMTLRVNKRENA